MLSIRRITEGNPFEQFPQLRTIWPEPFITTAEEAVCEHLLEGDNFYLGEIFLVLHDENVIGITGYFIFDEHATQLGLRWHGVVQDYRGKGLSAQVLTMVLQKAALFAPSADTLIELVPMTEYGAPLVRHFEKLGFNKVGEQEKYDWSEYFWQPYHLDIAGFLGSLNPSVAHGSVSFEPR